MRAAVLLQEIVVKALHTHAQSGDAQVSEAGDLVGVERARLRLTGELGIRSDLEITADVRHQILELRDRKRRRRPTTEIDGVELATLNLRSCTVCVELLVERVQVSVHRLGSSIRVDLVEAEGAALAAVGQVHVKRDPLLVPDSVAPPRLQGFEGR